MTTGQCVAGHAGHTHLQLKGMFKARALCIIALGTPIGACINRSAPVTAASAGIGTATSSASALARARADSMRLPYTAADIAFMSRMIGHHAQAVVMARLAPERSEAGSVRTLAERIINAQQDEIVIMQRWLRDRGQPVPDPNGPMAGHEMIGHSHDAAMSGMTSAASAPMPGMLSPAQLAELDSARGAAFDELFLTFMIQHHTGAVSMVQDLFNTPGAGQDETVFKFASDVNVDQTTEITRMKQMLVMLKLQKK